MTATPFVPSEPGGFGEYQPVGPMPMWQSPELISLQESLLTEKIRRERAEAEMAEIDLASKLDGERDRQVKHGKIRLLNINGPIIGAPADAWLDALQHWERRDPGQPVTVQIMSPGGSVTDGLAIYDTLMRMRRKGHHVITHGSGLVASMATVLLQAGDERVLDSRAKMMLHEGSITLSSGSLTSGEQEDLRSFSKLLTDDITNILTERSTLTKRQLQNRWSRRDWYITADEALKLGFVDRVE